MQLKTIARGLIAAGLIAMTACTASADTNTKQLNAVKAKIIKLIPGREVVSVKTTPMKGIYEVVLQGNVIGYTDSKADYLLIGDMIDMAKKKSLTEDRKAELSKVDFAKLPFDLAIKEVRGDGSRKLAVFSDPDCPFCKRLEQESLKGIDNITIYTFLMPIPDLHPDAVRKSKLIWCAADRNAAWNAWILNGKLPEGGKDNCDNPVEKSMALGRQMGINGTPALIFANGRNVPGAIPKEEILKFLTEK